MTDHRAYIGLGSNLDDPQRQLEQAFAEFDRLPLTRLLRRSRLFASAPVGPQDQPDYLNAVAELSTRLSPLALLDQLQTLEQRHRRVRQRRWGPRTLDLDLLLYDEQHWDTPRLSLPHPEMHRRGFVLVPLAELAGERYLYHGQTIAELAQQHVSNDLRALAPQR
ncbi:2-amino-4-hydroxy-6-hydroxymethyldihydropteridine diphosphokinase [Halomonas shantousis]